MIENDRAVGIEVSGPTGKGRIVADVVVLAAGGLKTPVILQNSGFDRAGQKLFIDTCEIWLGVTPEIDISREPPMQLVYTEMAQSHRISLSTVYSKNRERLRYYCGEKADLFLNANWFGVLVKIGDESVGRVFADGTVSKGVTAGGQEEVRARAAPWRGKSCEGPAPWTSPLSSWTGSMVGITARQPPSETW